MRNGKFAKKGAMSKTLVLVLSLILIIGCVTGGTLAWLLDTSVPVKNTFTDSDIGVHLDETKPVDKTAKMVPGWTIEKDPKAWVDAASEDCYLFVKVEEKDGVVEYTKAGETQKTTTKWSDFLTYKIADGWTKLTGEGPGNGTSVYYKKFTTGSADVKGTPYSILSGDKVEVKGEVTKEMMDALNAENYPTLTFTAYASQMYKDNTTPFSAAEAWKNVSGETITP